MTIKDKLLKAREPVAVDVGLDELVLIKPMTGAVRAKYLEKIDGGNNTELSAWLIVYSLVEADGSSVFADNEINKVLEMDGVIIDTLIEQILGANGMTEKAMTESEKK